MFSSHIGHHWGLPRFFLFEEAGFFEFDYFGNSEALYLAISIIVYGVLKEVSAFECEGRFLDLFERSGLNHHYWKSHLIFFILPTCVEVFEVVTAIVGLLRFVVLSLIFGEVGAELFEGVLCGLRI